MGDTAAERLAELAAWQTEAEIPPTRFEYTTTLMKVYGLERAYRALARLAPTSEERIGLVDLANQVRPRTLV